MRVKRAMERLSLAALLALLIAAACIADAHEVRRSIEPLEPGLTAHPKLSIIRQAPAFVLHDTKRRPVRLEDSRRRVVLLSFIYTTCTTACPLLTERIGRLRDRLQSVGDWGRRVNFFSITVDPQRDTAQRLQQYAELFGKTDDVWRFLRGEPEELRPVLAAYGEWVRPLSNGELDHPARVFLIDARGNVREIYALEFFDERQAFFDIHALLAEAH
jgi:protein SCO1